MSAVVYLNEAWKPEHGGQLRLYPSWNDYIDIAPIQDRLVLFASNRMPHRYKSYSLKCVLSVTLTAAETVKRPLSGSARGDKLNSLFSSLLQKIHCVLSMQ